MKSEQVMRAIYEADMAVLKLSRLTNRRRRWYNELDQLLTEHLAKHWSLNDLAVCDLIPSQHRLSPFFSLTRQFFGPIAEQALKQHAPN